MKLTRSFGPLATYLLCFYKISPLGMMSKVESGKLNRLVGRLEKKVEEMDF